MAMSVRLSEDDLSRLFPGYLVVDGRGVIRSNGPSLDRHLGRALTGAGVLDEFDVVRPLRVTGVEQLLVHEQVVTLRHRRMEGLQMQGVVQKDDDAYFFLMSHVPTADGQAAGMSYRFSDFSPFDGSKELFLAFQVRAGLLKDAHQLTEQLKAEKLAAEAANAAKSQFLACMSHEIRTPLNGVLGMGALLEATELDENQRLMLTSIRNCGTSLLETLNDIIDISRMDAEQLGIEDEEFEVEDLVDYLLTTYKLRCDEKAIALDVRLDRDLASAALIADGARIRQVLRNLVSNALKFTEEGAIVVRICGSQVDGDGRFQIDFTVEDTGIGIEREHLETIFEPFVQGDSGITRRYGGTGLGLNICRRLCGLMGGEISVESTPGVGSKFAFSLPVRLARTPRRDDARYA